MIGVNVNVKVVGTPSSWWSVMGLEDPLNDCYRGSIRDIPGYNFDYDTLIRYLEGRRKKGEYEELPKAVASRVRFYSRYLARVTGDLLNVERSRLYAGELTDDTLCTEYLLHPSPGQTRRIHERLVWLHELYMIHRKDQRTDKVKSAVAKRPTVKLPGLTA